MAEIRAEHEFDVGEARPATDSAEIAYERVLRNAGADHPRDSVDRRLVEGVRAGTHRMIDSQREVGGWPPLASLPPPPDTDGDGMPDAWEKAHHLDPEAAADGAADRDRDGYTNLEEYLNGLCSGTALD